MHWGIPLAFKVKPATVVKMPLIAVTSAFLLMATSILPSQTPPANGSDLATQPAILAAVISAGVGLIVFAGTQWVIHCREKTSLLLEKLEALYIGLGRLSQLGIKRAEYYAQDESIEGLMKVRGTRLTDEIVMLQSFHFPAINQPAAAVMKQNSKVLELLGGPNRANSKDVLKDETMELMRLIALASTLICENQNSLTKARWFHYLPGIRAFNGSFAIKTNS